MNGQYGSSNQSGNSMNGRSSNMQNGNMSQNGSMNNQTAMNNNMSGHGNWHGEHTMSATVKNIDHQAGTVKINSEGKNLTVAFAPSSLHRLHQGQKIKVHFAIRDNSSTSSNMSR
jgi:hypothetical protein